MKKNFLNGLFQRKPKGLNLKKIFKPDKKTKKLLLGYLFYGLLGLIFLSAISFAWFSKDLPTPSKIANRKATESTKIYDRTGEILLYETGEQKRTLVESGQISQYLKDATIAIEDDRFFEHHGIDLQAIGSAVIEKISGKRQVARGGSTITQQYIKNALLSSDRSLVRKIKEAILALELEFMFNKDEILTMYLNEIPYGGATAGAEAASRIYYGIPASDLTLAQAATLAAIPQAPTYYSPYGTHVDNLVDRRNYVLDRMTAIGKISAEEAEAAKLEDTTTLGTVVKERRDSMLAPHFAMYILEQIADEYGEEKVQKEGLKIITTLDFEKQKAAEESIANGSAKILKYNANNAALVAVDPKNGQVLAMVGSRDYFNTEIDGNVNITTSLRQPGSSFKPFAYATAFKKQEYFPGKIIFDLQTDFGGGYTPSNYNGNFSGPVTIRHALANSLNIPAVKILALAGLDNTLRTAEDMGITTLNQRDRYGLSLVLGAGEVKPLEMAGAFGVFATNGIKYETRSILKITDGKGKTLEEYNEENDNKGKKVLDPQIAYEISNILSDNNARTPVFGPRSSLFFPNRTVAAKTGTTSDFKDAWTVGFTPSLAVAVWVGNNDSTKMKSGADGSVLAGPIFHEFITKGMVNQPNEEFTRPEGIQEISVEKYSGKLPNEKSPEKITDIFASWQVPTQTDDANKIIKVCKGSNLLAPADMPIELTEDKVFLNIHSEWPENANWENPVLGWLQANGMISSVPTETCKKEDFVPNVTITSPAQGAAVSGTITISASTSGPFAISKVEFYLNEVLIGLGTFNGTVYTLSYDSALLDDGTHTLKAIATDINNVASAPSSVTFTLNDEVAPVISEVSANTLTTTSAQLLWKTDEASTSEVTYWKDGDTAQKTETNTELVKNHVVILKNLEAGATYYYKVNSKDKNENLQISTQSTFKLAF